MGFVVLTVWRTSFMLVISPCFLEQRVISEAIVYLIRLDSTHMIPKDGP